MAIGTTAAILAATTAASAGAQLYGAKKASDASKQAAQIQQKSADQALLEARNAYNQQVQWQMPYMNAGNSAINTLSRLMAPPQGARYAAPAPASVQFQPMGAGGANPFMVQPQQPSATQMRMVGSGQTPMAAQSPFMLR